MQIERDEFEWFFRLVPISGVIGVSAMLLLRPNTPPLTHSKAFGCYSAFKSPNILLDAAGMHVRQKGFPIIGFHLERHKGGIALAAHAPVSAELTSNGYRLFIETSGSGRYLPFYRVHHGRTYGVYDELDLQGFEMLASNDVSIKYEPADLARCI